MTTAEQERSMTNSKADDQHRVRDEITPLEDISDYLREYARQKPETTALVCIGIGFVLGWRLKPW